MTRKTKLHLSDKLAVPLEIVTAKTTILGMPGSGKSWLMFLLAELFLDHQVQTVFLDPKGEAWGLRLAADGKTPAYPIPIFGGDHGDFPLRPEMGARIADMIVEGDYSAILDVSEFTSKELFQFGYDFASRLILLKKKKPGAMSLMIDEVQEFIPQNPDEKGMQVKMLGQFERVAKLLRSKGVGMVMATQRPQEFNKKVMNLSEYWFSFQMTGLSERQTLQKLFKEKDVEEAERLFDTLPKLEVGVSHVWSPRVLKISADFKIGPRKTFDSSSTPEVGARAVKARKLAPVDAKALTKAMDAIVEEERRNSPIVLHQEIAELNQKNADLEKRLAEASKPKPAPKAKTQIKTVPAFKDSQVAEMHRLLDRTERMRDKFDEAMDRFHTGVRDDVLTIMAKLATDCYEAGQASVAAAKAAVNGDQSSGGGIAPLATQSIPGSAAGVSAVFTPGTFPAPPAAAPTLKPARQAMPSDGTGPTPPQLATIQAIRLLEESGLPNPSIPLVAIVKGVSHTTGSFGQDLRNLVAGDYIARLEGNRVATKPAGQTVIVGLDPIADPITSEAQLHAMLLNRIARRSKPQADILRVVMQFYPGRMHRENVARVLGKSHTTGSFGQDCRDLRTAGLITFHPSQEDKPKVLDTMRAADVLYPISARKQS